MKDKFISLIKTSKKISVITGAGISAESGVPTFRGENGLWRSYRPEDLATPEAFTRDPKLVWEWYNWRRELISNCTPNSAHLFISYLESLIPEFLLITQNVDGLHKRGGSRNIIEIHGSIWDIKCSKCLYLSENRDLPIIYPPLCPQCQNILRPGVVWFGESLDYRKLEESVNFIAASDLLIVIGTSGIVQPVASLPFQGKQINKKLKIIEINPTSTPITNISDLFIKEPSAKFLSDLKIFS